MNIQELEDKHGDIPFEPLGAEEFLCEKHTKLSVEFAISVLEEVDRKYPELIHYNIQDKIQELKTYLDEKIL